ncbi:unnamed protein product [Linum tenue]|uniref:Uncharacterized protein n=2 Tax=Linum tenue TaxID=586396 RepID=A0AAV0P3C3_9ROSI|nr:unnamed protein product [Linum tenue]CAI0464891.1 unnamed protein product [Linum tenue]CAI0540774.1 unnamed protein product [Linum tenue]
MESRSTANSSQHW